MNTRKRRKLLGSCRITVPIIVLLLTTTLVAYGLLSQLALTIPSLNKDNRRPGDELDPKAAEELEFWVHRYLRWHDANRGNASRLAVFLPVKAGLGDNVIGMFNLWAYAVLTKRLFLIDFKDPFPFGSLLSENTRRRFIYTEQDAEFAARLGGEKEIFAERKMSNSTVDLLKGKVPFVAMHLSISDNPEKFARRPPQSLRKVPKFSNRVRNAIGRILLDPSDEILQEKNKFYADNGLNDGKPYFGFHARLGHGVGEGLNPRFSKTDFNFVAECTAEKLVRIGAKYGVASHHLRVFLATDTPSFRAVFRNAMSKVARGSRVVAMKTTNVSHFLDATSHSSQVQMHVENTILGDAQEIAAFRSGFSQVARWRGKSSRLNQVYYSFCPHRKAK